MDSDKLKSIKDGKSEICSGLKKRLAKVQRRDK
jgi:hypothetical protein